MSLPLPLLVWLSPAFPVGSFAYSHGLEWAHESGEVTDRTSLESWVSDLLTLGSGRTDAILLAAAHRATAAGDDAALAEVAALAAALAPSAERHLETTAQGEAFFAAIAASWPTPALARLRAVRPQRIAYPVAVGVAAAGHGLALPTVLPAYLIAFVGTLVSAAVRLGVVGQTDGQRLTAAIVPTVEAVAAAAEDSTFDDLGSACLRADLASLRHETQYTRLFRS